MGFIIPDVPPIDPRFGRATPCVCKQAELDERRQSQLVRMSQLGELRHCTFDRFVPEGIGLPPAKARNLSGAFKRAWAYAEQPEGWLLLKGGYGCGKTHLAAAIANEQLARGRSVLFVNTPDLLDHLRGAYSPHSAVTYDQQFERVRNAPLLVLDDLGAHNTTEWAQEKLYQIFNYRYNARLPTVITTNSELESIEIRIRSRMSDLSFVQIVTILAPDFRRGGIYQEESDLSSLHLHADKMFESFDLRTAELTKTKVDNLRLALDAARSFSAEPRDWLVLQSNQYGNGKTHLAAAIANDVAQRGESVLFVVVPDLLDHLRATFSPASAARLDKRFAEVRDAQLLILDDLGTESATNWAREKLYQLFNHRYNARLPTVITTATPIDELDPRLAARMLDGNRCAFYVVEAPTYRGNRKRTRRSR